MLVDRLGLSLAEASTWRGIVVLVSYLGVQLDPEQEDAIVGLGVAGYVFLACFFRRQAPA